MGSDEEIIIRFAARQHGVITRAQLLGAGLTRREVERRLKVKRLRPLHRGVYLADAAASPHARDMAAVLACGPGAVLSHGSASRLWQLVRGGADRPVDVTTPGDRSRRPGIRGHRACRLQPEDLAEVEGIPVTSVARTLLDVAGEVSCGSLRHRDLEQALASAERQQLVSEREVRSVVDRNTGSRGVGLLRIMLESDGRTVFTRSQAEESLLGLIRKAKLPAPEVNVGVGRFEVDFLWRSRGVAVEVDGFAFHSSRARFEADRRRDVELAAEGIHVVRLSWRQITRSPESVIAQLAGILARRGPPS